MRAPAWWHWVLLALFVFGVPVLLALWAARDGGMVVITP